MKTFALFLLALWVIVVSIAPAFGVDNKRLRKEFKALYAKQVAVGKTRDVKAIMEFNTPDYSVKLLNGSTLSRKQLEQGMSQYFTSGQLIRQISFSNRILETTVNGEEVVVLVEQRDKRIQMRSDGKPHKVEANVVHRDTWVKTAAGWKRRLTEEVKQTKFTVDDKPVDPGARAEKEVGEQRTLVTGTLLGHNDQPMLKAHLDLSRFNQSKPLTSVAVGQDGSFKLVTTETGLLVVRFTGVDHQSRQITLLVDKPMEIDLNVRLKTYDYRDDFGEVKIIGDFNDFSFKSAKVMARRSDGTYFAEFDTAADRFAYQLLGVVKGNGSINGTQSADYVYDGGGDYRSVVMPKDGHVTVTFDPRALVRSEADGWAKFKNVTSSAARFVSIYEAMMARRDHFHDALVEYKKTPRPLNEFSYDWSPDLADVAQKILEEKRPLLRQALLFSYLDIGYGTNGAKLDAPIARRALAEIPPTSPLWSIEPWLIGVAIDSVGEPQSYASYVKEVINNHSDPAVVKIVRASLSPDRQIVVGKTVPAFSLTAFEKPGTTYTSENLKGKIVLIDFWATWCVPCIEEMPNLHQEYEKFKAQGFEILSVSLDEKPDVVNEFRKEKWKMPWLHSLLTSSPEVKKQFEIVGIPRGVLIGRDGRIIATDRELRGRNLDRTLTQLLPAPR